MHYFQDDCNLVRNENFVSKNTVKPIKRFVNICSADQMRQLSLLFIYEQFTESRYKKEKSKNLLHFREFLYHRATTMSF